MLSRLSRPLLTNTIGSSSSHLTHSFSALRIPCSRLFSSIVPPVPSIAGDSLSGFSSASQSSLPSFTQQLADSVVEKSLEDAPLATIPSSTWSELLHGYGSTDHLFELNHLDPRTLVDPTNRTFTYLMQGSSAFMWASVGRLAVFHFVNFLTATADVMAVASIEVDIGNVVEGSATTVKWRGKPVFIRHRTAKEISAAEHDDNAALRDPQTDSERFKDKKEWAILIGVCTHLGCVPINNAGDWGGWFCPCHGSHYDTSGRIRKGPAPLNLEVPKYKFLSDTKVLLG